MVSIVGQIRWTETGRWPVQREFNRRMKLRFQQNGIDVASATQTVLMHIAPPGWRRPSDAAAGSRLIARRQSLRWRIAAASAPLATCGRQEG